MKTWKSLSSMAVLIVALSFIVISNNMDDKPYTEDLGVYTVTAYCPCKVCCGRYSDGITASGHKIQPDDYFVAAPPSIPFGTWLIVPGYNDGWPAEVLDRGGAIGPFKLDVYFSDHDMALQWGRRTLRIMKVNVREKE